MGTTCTNRNSLSFSFVTRNDSQGCKYKDLSVFSNAPAPCRRALCLGDFSLLTSIAYPNGAAQGGVTYVIGQSYITPVYRHIGQKCRPTRNLTLRAGAFSILDKFNETLNKRADYFRRSDYSV
jgi:hypothetical protein